MVALAYRKTIGQLGHFHKISRWRDVLYCQGYLCVCMFVFVRVYVYIPQCIFVNTCGKLKRCALLCHGKGEEIVTVRDMVALAYRRTMDRVGHFHRLSRWRDVLFCVTGKLNGCEICDSKSTFLHLYWKINYSQIIGRRGHGTKYRGEAICVTVLQDSWSPKNWVRDMVALAYRTTIDVLQGGVQS